MSDTLISLSNFIKNLGITCSLVITKSEVKVWRKTKYFSMKSFDLDNKTNVVFQLQYIPGPNDHCSLFFLYMCYFLIKPLMLLYDMQCYLFSLNR